MDCRMVRLPGSPYRSSPAKPGQERLLFFRPPLLIQRYLKGFEMSLKRPEKGEELSQCANKYIIVDLDCQ